jgi:hypothetical protein
LEKVIRKKANKVVEQIQSQFLSIATIQKIFLFVEQIDKTYLY